MNGRNEQESGEIFNDFVLDLLQKKPTSSGCCSACDDPIIQHYKNGCELCKCVRTFGSTTLPEDNEPKQYKD